MEFKTNFFEQYLKEAPLALALERTLECMLLSKQSFKRPILDIGCGEGLFAKNLFNEKLDLGIDPNPKELERAQFHDVYKELLNCKGDEIPKEDGSFNTILSNSVLEHIPDIDKVLSEAHRLLSTDGRLYLTLPTIRFDQFTLTHQVLKKLKLHGLSARYSRLFNQFWAHYHYYDTAEWMNKFESLGFEIVACQEYASKTTCMLNSLTAPFSLIPFLTKKFNNRWFIFEKVRCNTAKWLKFIFQFFTKDQMLNRGEGGLVFFALKKKSVETL